MRFFVSIEIVISFESFSTAPDMGSCLPLSRFVYSIDSIKKLVDYFYHTDTHYEKLTL